jgi:hypothetical protein
MIPSTFSPAWRAAIERGDASGFTSSEDAVAFFDATSNAGCFFSLSMDQRGTVGDLRSHPDMANLFTASASARHARGREAERNLAAAAAPRFILGRTSPDRIPTLAELKPELDAINTELAKVSAKPGKRSQAEIDAMWTKATEKVNRELGFNSLAREIYARRNARA